jgi:hypothetical protein
MGPKGLLPPHRECNSNEKIVVSGTADPAFLKARVSRSWRSTCARLSPASAESGVVDLARLEKLVRNRFVAVWAERDRTPSAGSKIRCGPGPLTGNGEKGSLLSECEVFRCPMIQRILAGDVVPAIAIHVFLTAYG